MLFLKCNVLSGKQVERTIFSFGAYFGDHMVFQRAPSQAVVWGYSSMSSDNTNLNTFHNLVCVICQGTAATG